jgi:flagellar basal-body rod protein FlgB
MPVPAPAIVDQVSSSLSLVTLRHQVIASNIANRDSIGYQRLAVQFSSAMAAESAANARIVAEEPSTDSTAAAPSLERDMVDLSNNAMNYQTLARALTKYFAIAATVANGGKG